MALVKDETTKTIEAKWSMKVWHKERNKMVFTKYDCAHIFHDKLQRDFVIKKPVLENNNFIVTIKISKWTVTNN